MIRSIAVVVLLTSFGSNLIARADDGVAWKLEGWGEVTDPDTDCQIRVENGKVVFALPGTAQDFAAELKRWNGPRILSDVQGDFITDVKVSGEFVPGNGSTIAGRHPYNGAGLFLVQDQHNYLILLRGAVRTGNNVRHYLNFELRKNSKLAVSKYSLGLDNQDTFLRVERCGNKVYGLASSDGTHWRSYEPITISFPNRIQAGVVAVSSSDAPFSCGFERFQMRETATNQTGSLNLTLVGPGGTTVGTFSQSFAVGLSGNNVLSFALPGALAAGHYTVQGKLVIAAGTGPAPAGIYNVPPVPVTLSVAGAQAWSTNGFCLVLQGPIGSNYLIEATSDLSSATNWRPILYFAVTNSPVYLSDPTSTNYMQRFYRAVMQ